MVLSLCPALGLFCDLGKTIEFSKAVLQSNGCVLGKGRGKREIRSSLELLE